MMTKSAILGKLSPFQNFNKILVDDQSTNDIVKGILNNHELYKEEYDKISESFIGDNVKSTARNVWNFLKTNVPYYIEPISKQTLRSPSAILALRQGADCKAYATFANGIFDSLNRKGIFNVPIAYRFASYRDDSNEFQHVFSVLYPGTNNEIWIDPVLDRFDQRKEPTYYKDKKINMALIAMSGTVPTQQPSLEEMQAYRDKLVNTRDRGLNNGTIKPGSSKEMEFKVAINKVTNFIQDASINGIGENGDSGKGFDWNNLFKQVIDVGASLVKANNPPSTGYQYPGYNQYPQQPMQQSSGMGINNYLLIAAAGLGVYLLLKK